MINKAFSSIGFNTENSHEIYVFMGSYKKNYIISYDTLSPIKNAKWTDYNIYWNLEIEKSIKVLREKVESFGKNHIVIDNPIANIKVTYQDYYNNFLKIQN